jgi:hypothetical protein
LARWLATPVTDLAESGAADETIWDIAGHVSKQMLKHYSHIRMKAKQGDWNQSSRSLNRPLESARKERSNSPH